MKKRTVYVLMGLAAYALLLALLVLAESFAPESGIRTLGDALWYSFVTMTTVGYGDLYPVTLAGRLIGFVFLLASMGVLAAALSLAAALLLGRLFPKLRLLFLRNRRFWLFTSVCEESLLLARKLSTRDSSAVPVFLAPDGLRPPSADKRAVFFRGTFEELARVCKRIDGIFVFGPDDFRNLFEADRLLACGAPVYCESAIGRRIPNDSLTVFDRHENLARLYWQQYPAAPSEQCVVLIGMGQYGRRLLEQALLVNVFGAQRCMEYHVFGDSDGFLREHTRLHDTLSVNAPSAEQDAVVFHAEPWNADEALLSRADRLIVCTDGDRRNMAILGTLFKRYPITGAVHIRLLTKLDGTIGSAIPFGACEDLFTPEMVMRERLNRLAMAMNELYRRQSGGSGPGWQGLSAFHRQSSAAAADHLLTKLRLLLPDEDVRTVTMENCAAAYAVYSRSLPGKADWYRRVEHARWMRFHCLNNWRWAEQRDNDRRLHPLLLPFDQLPYAEQIKDDAAWELLGKVGELLGTD